jgi:hypothetical protein
MPNLLRLGITMAMFEMLQLPQILQVAVSAELLTVNLTDGRVMSVPIAWYPRLLHGTPAERNHWRLTASQEGIHWPDLDEDISLKNMLLGQSSGESQTSLQRWLESRQQGRDRPS